MGHRRHVQPLIKSFSLSRSSGPAGSLPRRAFFESELWDCRPDTNWRILADRAPAGDQLRDAGPAGGHGRRRFPAGATPFTITGLLTIGGTVQLQQPAGSGTLKNYITGYLILVVTAMTGTATISLVDGTSSTNKLIDGLTAAAAVGSRIAMGPGRAPPGGFSGHGHEPQPGRRLAARCRPASGDTRRNVHSHSHFQQ